MWSRISSTGEFNHFYMLFDQFNAERRLFTIDFFISIVASLLKSLRHANIVTLHDIVHTKLTLNFVFEYVVGLVSVLPRLTTTSSAMSIFGGDHPRSSAVAMPFLLVGSFLRLFSNQRSLEATEQSKFICQVQIGLTRSWNVTFLNAVEKKKLTVVYI